MSEVGTAATSGTGNVRPEIDEDLEKQERDLLEKQERDFEGALERRQGSRTARMRAATSSSTIIERAPAFLFDASTRGSGKSPARRGRDHEAPAVPPQASSGVARAKKPTRKRT